MKRVSKAYKQGTPPFIKLMTRQGEQSLSEGYWSIDYSIEPSNTIGHNLESTSTIIDGYRSSETIIDDNLKKYSEVWKSLS